MSEDITKYQNDQITQLTRQLASRKEQVRRLKGEIETLTKERNDLATERDSLNTKISEFEPSVMDRELARLKTELKVRDIREKFRIVEGQLGDKVTLDKLFKYHDFNPADADLESLDVDGLVTGWRDAAPALFRSSGGHPESTPDGEKGPALVTGLPNGRGMPDMKSGRVTYTREDVRSSGWQQRRPELVEAIRRGEAELID